MFKISVVLEVELTEKKRFEKSVAVFTPFLRASVCNPVSVPFEANVRATYFASSAPCKLCLSKNIYK
jgi:hypothetical protein